MAGLVLRLRFLLRWGRRFPKTPSEWADLWEHIYINYGCDKERHGHG